jgi:hypothetical protein
MKAELDDAMELELTEQSDQAEHLCMLREQVADSIAWFQEVTDENQRLRWELLRCATDCIVQHVFQIEKKASPLS